MDKILAGKYLSKAEQNDPSWESILFNKLCTNLDFEKDMIDERKSYQEHIIELNEMIAEKQKIEIFLINTITDKEISTIFKMKLKRYMKEAGLQLDIQDDKPFVSTDAQSATQYPQ